MSYFKPSEYCCEHLNVLTEKCLWWVVRGDDHNLMLKINLSSFGLSCAGVSIRPDLKVMPEADTTFVEVV